MYGAKSDIMQDEKKKGNLWCVCKKANHSREICWKLHDKLANWIKILGTNTKKAWK